MFACCIVGPVDRHHGNRWLCNVLR